MKLSIIIVNYKSSSYIIDCINSAMQFKSGSEFEWIIVDNASNDDSEMKLKSAFPFIQWINMGYNAGFARANNEGMKIASGDAFLLLNPDTIILDDAISECFKKFVQSNHVACGLQLLSLDHSPQNSGSKFMKGGINHLLPLPYWGRVLKYIAGFLKMKRPSILIAQAEEQVDWISGAFLMVKRSSVLKAGMMDEDFFLYGEEVEWCSRLLKLGSLCIYGDYHIIHLEGAVIGKESKTIENSYANIFDKKGLQLIVSNHLRIRKQYGLFWLLFQLLNYTIGSILFFVVQLFIFVFSFKKNMPMLRQAYGLIVNVINVWILLPRMILNRPYFYKVL